MTNEQVNYIVYVIICWASIIIMNITTNVIVLIWFALVAFYCIYQQFTCKSMWRTNNE